MSCYKEKIIRHTTRQKQQQQQQQQQQNTIWRDKPGRDVGIILLEISKVEEREKEQKKYLKH